MTIPHTRPELVAPAGSLRALKLAVDAGADAVYLGLRNATNARNFAGLNFDLPQIREGVAYAHARGRKVLVALNTFVRAADPKPWYEAVDCAAELGADALICADVAVMAYARDHHPALRLHLSVQASATSHEAIAFYRQHYGIQRAVLPRVLTLSQVGHLLRNAEVEIEVFGFGSLCVMVEGRCALSSYATGQSPNNAGVCSPPSAVRWTDTPAGVESRLGGLLIDRYAPDEPRGYPTLCKGRFDVGGRRDYAIEEPTSLNTLAILPELMAIGVRAIKLEGRQRSPAYVEQITRVWRQAIDAAATAAAAGAPGRYRVEPAWTATLGHLAEGQQHTLGAYERPWQ
ncbi:peptidase (collagenase-like) [Rubrivivax sp. A210]|uniref:ubiquinone anaerobic biosynthesis protein UbiU n=1 Tax=Rubrivivax sp. A210 TaxID=2772301 RepID=UPI001917E2F4|nr:peptidase U32 family protein [Rubrivivax sp. A210]CAD5373099.1 peptidase (collagenase-like) [Rubrivivax sp. A210]